MREKERAAKNWELTDGLRADNGEFLCRVAKTQPGASPFCCTMIRKAGAHIDASGDGAESVEATGFT
jgi:hypothetical protein